MCDAPLQVSSRLAAEAAIADDQFQMATAVRSNDFVGCPAADCEVSYER